jgi:hypothetical protein
MWLFFATVLLARAADPSVGEWSWAAVPFSSASGGARRLEVIVDASQVRGAQAREGQSVVELRVGARLQVPKQAQCRAISHQPSASSSIMARW